MAQTTCFGGSERCRCDRAYGRERIASRLEHARATAAKPCPAAYNLRPWHLEDPIPFGKYELLERINIGGMAEILKARDQSVAGAPIVAVKRILPHLVDDRQFVAMFRDESRLLSQLEHENMIHTLEVGRGR